jgi:hypothetical protein
MQTLNTKLRKLSVSTLTLLSLAICEQSSAATANDFAVPTALTIPTVSTTTSVATTPSIISTQSISTTTAVDTIPAVITTPSVVTQPIAGPTTVATTPSIVTTQSFSTTPMVVTAPTVDTTSSVEVIPTVVKTPEVITTPSIAEPTTVATTPSIVATQSLSTTPVTVTTPSVAIIPSIATAPVAIKTTSVATTPAIITTTSLSTTPVAAPTPSIATIPSITTAPVAIKTTSVAATPVAVPTPSVATVPVVDTTPSITTTPAVISTPSVAKNPTDTTIPTSILPISAIPPLPQPVITEDPLVTQIKATDRADIDARINVIGKYARHYPTHFDNIRARHATEAEIKDLLETLNPIAKNPKATHNELVQAFKVNGMARNLDIGSNTTTNADNYIRRALKLEPKNPETNYWFGVLLSEGGGMKEGIPYLNKAAKSKYNEAYLSLANAYLGLGKKDEALASLRTYEKLVPTDTRVPDMLDAVKQNKASIW